MISNHIVTSTAEKGQQLCVGGGGGRGKNGAAVRALASHHAMWPGDFKSRRRRHMWVEFVVGSLPCSE